MCEAEIIYVDKEKCILEEIIYNVEYLESIAMVFDREILFFTWVWLL